FFSSLVTGAPRDLHPFPTRRSSDLNVADENHGSPPEPVAVRSSACRARVARSAPTSEGSLARTETNEPTAISSGGAVGSAVARSDRKSTRLNSSHLGISYAVFCLKK